MSSKSTLALGAAVVVLAGFSSYVGAHLAQPAPDEPAGPENPSDRRSRDDEIDRALGNQNVRITRVEDAIGDLRNSVDALLELRARAPGGQPAAGPAGDEAHVAKPTTTGTVTPVPEAGNLPVEKTDEELQAERVAKIHAGWKQAAKTFVPARLTAFADDRPGAAERRRHGATLEARQMALAIGVEEKQLDAVEALYRDVADRTARDVGPLVRDGLERADLVAVQAKLDETWAEMDRRAKEILGTEQFQKFVEVTTFERGHFRDVLQPKPPK